jgi:hypothetical protein
MTQNVEHKKMAAYTTYMKRLILRKILHKRLNTNKKLSIQLHTETNDSTTPLQQGPKSRKYERCRHGPLQLSATFTTVTLPGHLTGILPFCPS